MNKIKFIGLTSIATIALAIGVAVAAGLSKDSDSSLVLGEPANAYSMKTGLCSQEEISAGGFTRNTKDGNPISFEFGGAYDFDTYSVVKLQGSKGQACVSNVTPITGLQSISFRCLTNQELRVYYGSTPDSMNGYVELTSANFVEPVGATVVFEGENVQYFSIGLNQSNWSISYVKEITINYACEETHRGQAFTAGANLVVPSATAIPLTDTVILDIKFTTPATNSYYVNFLLAETSGLTDYYGYYAFYANGLLGGNYAGMSVKPLTDGFYRITIVLSELTVVTGSPSNINLIFIRGDWTKGSGYIDLNPSENAAELLRQTTSLGTNFNTKRHIGLNEKMVADIRFDANQNEREYIAFSDGSLTNFYGYYGVWSTNGTLSNNIGITKYIVGVHHYLYEMNISELTVVTGDKSAIEYINLFIFSGGKTGTITLYSA